MWWRVTCGEARLVVGGGVLAGLAAALAPSALDWRGPNEAGRPAGQVQPLADPYAEARRSRAILAAQEGAPPPAIAAAARTRPVTGGPQAVVIDGDTFRLGADTIRIADIDTPELRGRCPYESALAARATARMAQLLRKGPFALSPVDRDTDRYGRKLRIVTRGGRSLGDQLVAEGLARTWTGRREPWC